MTDTPQYLPGQIIWRDLTVPDAENIRDFYSAVVGWEWANHPVDDYNDFDIKFPATGEVVTGICHKQGSNANLPPAWILYVYVEDVAASAKKCVELGGKIIDGPREMGDGQFCVIRDPAGAFIGLMKM